MVGSGRHIPHLALATEKYVLLKTADENRWLPTFHKHQVLAILF